MPINALYSDCVSARGGPRGWVGCGARGGGGGRRAVRAGGTAGALREGPRRRAARMIFPELNAERRKDLTKQVKKGAEDAKVAVRAIRRDAIEAVKKLKKDTLCTEDEQHKAEEDAQKLTDKAIKDIDTVAAAKEKEIMEV